MSCRSASQDWPSKSGRQLSNPISRPSPFNLPLVPVCALHPICESSVASSLQNPRSEFFFSRTFVADKGRMLSEQSETSGSESFVPSTSASPVLATLLNPEPGCVFCEIRITFTHVTQDSVCWALEEYSVTSHYFACHLLPFFFFLIRNSAYLGKRISR